jgi:hypothetical protein
VPYDRAVAYDEDLADRIRELIVSDSDLTEKKMFGGLAFLIGGNMAVAASGQGGVMVRVDPADSDTLLAATNARLAEMRGRQMQGWLRVDPQTPSHRASARQMGRTRRDLRSLADTGAVARRNIRHAYVGAS